MNLFQRKIAGCEWSVFLFLLVMVAGWFAAGFLLDQTPQVSESSSARLGQQELKEIEASNPRLIEQKIQKNPLLRIRFLVGLSGIVCVAVAALFYFLRMVWRLIRKKPVMKSIGSVPPPAWSLQEVLAIFVAVFIVLQLSFAFLELCAVQCFHLKLADKHLLSLSLTVMTDGVLILWTGILFRRQRDFSLGGPQKFLVIRRGIEGYLTGFFLLGCLFLIVISVADFFQYEPPPQPVLSVYLTESRTPVLVWLLILVTFIGPVAEELFFRGIFYGWCRTRIGKQWACVLTSFFFALMHTNWVAFLPIFGLGLILALIYETTGSLMAPIAVHVLHNGGMLYYAALIKSLFLSS